ncbi:MAG TPA: PIN-like domain-containing protein, partial [Lacipirellulaceae bacterium]|nr:PIN-like domain-containing protein [Lacipirellulaceae bacterium]
MAEDNRKTVGSDPFIKQRVYPEAVAIFAARVAPVVNIKDSCAVVLDTSTLLVPYSVGTDSLEQIKKTYGRLAVERRLIVPGQVAREFADHRAEKIKEVFHQLSQSRNRDLSLTLAGYPLLESLEAYQEAMRIKQEAAAQIKRYRDAIGNLLDVVRGWVWDDPVSLLYRELFTDQVVFDPRLDEQRVLADLEHRFSHQIPPGFKDAAKSL